jgi:ferredoxin
MLIEYEIKHDLYQKIVFDKESCTQCGYCVFACPNEIHKWDVEKEILIIENPDACGSCNQCVCPYEAKVFVPYNPESENYYSYIGTQEYYR